MKVQATEVAHGERFEFGKNWQRFLNVLDDDRIAEAEQSIRKMLRVDRLDGQRFLDVGCGSGLFSLAARRLGAEVHSFDFDPQSVACARELRRRYFPDDRHWIVEEGSALDADYLMSLPKNGVVYSWGVLHHTGSMWQALENVQIPVADGGRLCLSIYNDQGGASRRWRAIKRLYNHSPWPVRWLLIACVAAYFECRAICVRLMQFRSPLPMADWSRKKKDRGMSVWYDLIDWVGGYPFEVAKPEQVFEFFESAASN